MQLHLQFGWGMMELCRNLCQECGVNTTILSPRDLQEGQLISLSSSFRNLGGQVLLDPQFYLPRADHHRLTAHSYWPNDYDTAGFDGVSREKMMDALSDLNDKLETTYFIVPGERAETVDNHWLDTQWALLEAARNATGRPHIVTICLSAEAVRSNDQVGAVMEQAERMSAPGFYLVTERPGFAYIVEDPLWLANTLDLAAGLTRLGSQVIVGYSNHQQLIMACAGVKAIASGTWMNVRCFFPDKFRNAYEEEIKRRTTWYYCPQAMSEYTLPFLDIGFRLGLRDMLRPRPSTPFALPIFEVSQPSASGWGEPEAFRHYLMALHAQAQSSTHLSFDETVANHRAMLNTAEEILRIFQDNGLSAQNRGFQGAIAANRAALIVLERTHGPHLRRRWSDLLAN
jgi:hypothetical protein